MKKMKIKTSELIGLALDWAVAKCESRPHSFTLLDNRSEPPLKVVLFQPSTDWSQGGPIIEREKIFLVPSFNEKSIPTSVWGAEKYDRYFRPAWFGDGPTPLIAAMRAYVARKMGDEIEVPEELA
jgi:hypothetical protein